MTLGFWITWCKCNQQELWYWKSSPQCTWSDS